MKSEQTTSILRSVLALGRRLRAERPPGAEKLAVISILSTLYRSGPMPARQLAVEERLQPQSLTRLIGELEHKGWIARKRSKADRREISIDLTARGTRVLAEDIQARRLWLQAAMNAALTKDEQDVLLRAVDAMSKLARFETAAGP